jgi:hypothetical protein
VVQEYGFNQAVKVGDTRVIFKQVCFTKYSSKTRAVPAEYHIPWYYKAASRLPARMRLPLIKVCDFYRQPYQVNPDGTLKVKGMIISPQPYGENEGALGKSVDIEIYFGEDRFTLTGQQQEWGSNICLFSVFGDQIPDAVDEITAVVTDKETGEKKSLIIKPDWETKVYHNSWRPDFPFSPDETIRQMVAILSHKGVEQNKLQPYVLSSEANRFPWKNLEHKYWQQAYKSEMAYLGNYKDQTDVYTDSLMFIDGDEETVAHQKFYLLERGNKWKVIDVSKVEIIK